MKSTIPIIASEESALIVEGTVSSTLVVLFKTAVLRMIPYAIPGLMLVLIDLVLGCAAAKKRGERVRASTAIRRTLTKIFLYLCFIILSTTCAIAFQKDWIEWLILGLVYGNEFLSVIGNYLESKGLSFSMLAVYRWLLKLFAGKVGQMSDEEAGEIIQPRDKKGRFTKKEE